MSEWDPIYDPPERRRRSPIVPMRPYEEPKPAESPHLAESEPSKPILGRVATMLRNRWHDIVDDHARHRKD